MANSLKDLVRSVDWSKAMSGADARNAAIGSAIGGALLGGVGLAQDRDPEESKMAPMGDALMGAVLGGAAGYGIPKGISLFRDSGSLAPDGDKIKSNYLGWGLGGAAAGAGVFGRSFYQTLERTKRRLRENAMRTFAADADKAMQDVIDAEKPSSTVPRSVRERLWEKSQMFNTDRRGLHETERILSAYRRRILGSLLHGNLAKAKKLYKRLSELNDIRSMSTRGYAGYRDLMHHVVNEASTANGSRPVGLLESLLKGYWRKPGAFATHGQHYLPKALLGIGPTIPTMLRPLVRGGKYALGGAAIAALAHKLIGPSASNNYKK